MTRSGSSVAAQDGASGAEALSFGPFRLSPTERLLLRGSERVSLGGRALDLLIALVERAGEVVDRRQLIARVWPDVIVEEANLRVHLANLRKALGDGQDGARYITNVPGRGYCFVAPIERVSAPAARATTPSSPGFRLPARLTRMVGRDQTVEVLVSQVLEKRFVSVVGPGGMGKTTVAIAAAHVLADRFGDGLCFIDLGAHTEPTHVTTAVASALGCIGQGQDPMPGLLRFLGDKPTLLVLDNCEHLIDAVAALTERLFSEVARIHILTTTREALRVEGENVHLLLPLESPDSDTDLTAAEALSSPAVQLFMERASASGHRAELNDADAPIVAMICRRLDGMALAIELAAGRVGAYGVRGTADLLDNRFKLLWQGRRSALPRHQTMRAMLDWSYNLLTDREKQTLARLSVFVGAFTVDDAVAVAAEGELEALEVAHALASLINKSLVWASEYGGHTFHRLLDTTRTYAAAKLAESGEEQAVARRHAMHFVGLLRSDAVRITGFESLSQSRYAPRMGNLRAALQWSFSEVGDPRIGVDLAAQSAPLFLGFSLLGECEHWCERGLSALDDSDRGTVCELALLEALAISSMFTRGNSDAVRHGIERGLALAEALGSTQYQCHLLAGLNIFLIRIGDFRAALSCAERSVVVAAEDHDPAGSIMAEWSLGVTQHLVGDQQAAQRHCELGLELAQASGRLNIDFFGYDHRVRALLALGRALWLRGSIGRSLVVAQEAIDSAARRENPVNICISLIYTIPIYIWVGKYSRAEELVDRLVDHAAKYSLGPYHAVGLGLRGELMVQTGRAEDGVELLRGAVATLRAERHNLPVTACLRAMTEGLIRSGDLGEAKRVISEATELVKAGGAAFELPEFLRIKAEILLSEVQSDLSDSETLLLESIQCAKVQSALSWELRASMSLARLRMREGRVEHARTLLAGVYDRFTEGLSTKDLEAARDLLEHLSSARPAAPPSGLR